jgi:NAD(P)-dependent dehydrogenase (short-subunit alcohol dehydrogenase family)
VRLVGGERRAVLPDSSQTSAISSITNGPVDLFQDPDGLSLEYCCVARSRTEDEGPKRKVVIITGASRCIGAALVKRFRELDYGVVATSRSITKTGSIGDDATLTIEGDIGEPDTSARVVDAAMERFGRIDTLINNAGIFNPRPFVDYSLHDFTLMIGVNLRGFFHISQQAASRMLPAGSGHNRQRHRCDCGSALGGLAASARRAHQGWPCCGDPLAGDRIRHTHDLPKDCAITTMYLAGLRVRLANAVGRPSRMATQSSSAKRWIDSPTLTSTCPCWTQTC